MAMGNYVHAGLIIEEGSQKSSVKVKIL